MTLHKKQAIINRKRSLYLKVKMLNHVSLTILSCETMVCINFQCTPFSRVTYTKITTQMDNVWKKKKKLNLECRWHVWLTLCSVMSSCMLLIQYNEACLNNQKWHVTSVEPKMGIFIIFYGLKDKYDLSSFVCFIQR